MTPPPHDWIVPQWRVPPRVHALVTTRAGGTSTGAYASLNLGTAVGDDAEAVAENRSRLRQHLPADPRWLKQVHGTRVVTAESVCVPVDADASFTRSPNVVCAIQMADCLPLLLAARDGSVVGAAHAGWRGLAGGVVECLVAALATDPSGIIAWLGPAIGPDAFEVGEDVRSAFMADDAAAAAAFRLAGAGKWRADLFALARARLARAGVREVHGGGLCTAADPVRFFSHRRDRVTGRMAALVWLET
jgi:YfiH family protein